MFLILSISALQNWPKKTILKFIILDILDIPYKDEAYP